MNNNEYIDKIETHLYDLTNIAKELEEKGYEWLQV